MENTVKIKQPILKIVKCWVCDGTGKRIDAKTNKERKCVACNEGLVKDLHY